MTEAPLSIGVVGIALFLAGMEGRAAVIRARSRIVAAHYSFDTLSFCITGCALLSNVIWALRAWKWYWVICIVIGVTVASGVIVTSRSLAFWLAVRPLVAMATAASAGLLWVAYTPAG